MSLNWKGRSPANASPPSGASESPKPPTMTRSRTQVANAYAPGRLFTWEGGRGICMALPLVDRMQPSQMQRAMIKDGIVEFVTAWLARAESCRNGTPIYTEQCLHTKFLSHNHLIQVDIDGSFEFTRPSKMGYTPYPLLYQCTACRRLQHYESVADQAEKPLPNECDGHRSRWRQVDVTRSSSPNRRTEASS
jgi:hypothetical protein